MIHVQAWGGLGNVQIQISQRCSWLDVLPPFLLNVSLNGKVRGGGGGGGGVGFMDLPIMVCQRSLPSICQSISLCNNGNRWCSYAN